MITVLMGDNLQHFHVTAVGVIKVKDEIPNTTAQTREKQTISVASPCEAIGKTIALNPLMELSRRGGLWKNSDV